jgi:hypothetical protein
MPGAVAAVPRLGVIHLLLWMFGCAGASAGFHVFFDWTGIRPEDAPAVRVMHLVMSMAYGLTVVTLYEMIRGKVRGDSAFLSQPGHWLLVLAAAAALVDGASTLAAVLVFPGQSLNEWDPWMARQCFGWGAGAFVATWVFIRANVEWRWRAPMFVILFIALSRVSLLAAMWMAVRRGVTLFAWSFPANLFTAGIVLGVMALGLAAATDLLTGKRRDWMHWTGVAVWLGIATVPIAEYIRYDLWR